MIDGNERNQEPSRSLPSGVTRIVDQPIRSPARDHPALVHRRSRHCGCDRSSGRDRGRGRERGGIDRAARWTLLATPDRIAGHLIEGEPTTRFSPKRHPICLDRGGMHPVSSDVESIWERRGLARREFHVVPTIRTGNGSWRSTGSRSSEPKVRCKRAWKASLSLSMWWFQVENGNWQNSLVYRDVYSRI